ncbi:hypothetical protein ATANTOWER_003029 [Ataeniobius toweri]|uniref:Uncharacterized protein n=1 Tax=Ataeniobius toweri TaxID=208326 RepID=A0ABU7B1P0_9TELE|nr:hypothetical protein [Ataeniobius toweri]
MRFSKFICRRPSNSQLQDQRKNYAMYVNVCACVCVCDLLVDVNVNTQREMCECESRPLAYFCREHCVLKTLISCREGSQIHTLTHTHTQHVTCLFMLLVWLVF